MSQQNNYGRGPNPNQNFRNPPAPDANRLPSPPPKFIRGDMAEVIKLARSIGELLHQSGVKMNQLRNFFETVVQLGIALDDARKTEGPNQSGTNDHAIMREVDALPTKLVWAAAKQERKEAKKALTDFYKYVEVAVQDVYEPAQDGQKQLNFEWYINFREFVEAVIVYHKAREANVTLTEAARN